MGPRGTPQKSIFWSQKWHFPDFLFRGSVEGRGGCKPVVFLVQPGPLGRGRGLLSPCSLFGMLCADDLVNFLGIL